jgi:hypothetical protein
MSEIVVIPDDRGDDQAAALAAGAALATAKDAHENAEEVAGKVEDVAEKVEKVAADSRTASDEVWAAIAALGVQLEEAIAEMRSTPAAVGLTPEVEVEIEAEVEAPAPEPKTEAGKTPEEGVSAGRGYGSSRWFRR